MSDRPTPETDAAERMAYSQEYMVETEFARKLERERDEAREEANKLSGAYEDATNYYARIIELKEELDEAREALVKILKNE
jgi:predicted ribosome quality control (RQC) complex YloA/Tae2 family protein